MESEKMKQHFQRFANVGRYALVLPFLVLGMASFGRADDESAPPVHPITTTSRGFDFPMERPIYTPPHTEGVLGRCFPNIHGGEAIHLDYLYTGGVFNNSRGGIRTREATVYTGISDIGITIDTKKLGLWKNGTFYVASFFSHGPNVSDFTGDYQSVTVYAYETPAQVSEYWYEHRFFNDKVKIKAGKQDASADFFNLSATGDFLNASATCIPTTFIPNPPNNAWGVGAYWDVSERFCLKAGIFDAKPFGDRFWTSETGDLYSTYQIERHHSLCCGLPGFAFFGAWYDSSSIDMLDGSGKSRAGNYGFTAGVEQMLYRRNVCDDEDMRGVTAFFQYGWTEKNRGELRDYFGAGLTWLGLMQNRPEDSIGVGVNVARFSEGYRREESLPHAYESAWEFYYRVQLTENCMLQPDLQYVVHPGVEHNDAIVTGLVFQIVF